MTTVTEYEEQQLGYVTNRSVVIIVDRTERERAQGLVNESRRRVRAFYEGLYPTARVSTDVLSVTESGTMTVRVTIDL